MGHRDRQSAHVITKCPRLEPQYVATRLHSRCYSNRILISFFLYQYIHRDLTSKLRITFQLLPSRLYCKITLIDISFQIYSNKTQSPYIDTFITKIHISRTNDFLSINNSRKENFLNKYPKLRLLHHHPLIERRFARYERARREREMERTEFNPLTRVSDDRAR